MNHDVRPLYRATGTFGEKGGGEGGLNRIANRPNANKNGNSPSSFVHPLLHSDSFSALFRTKKILAFFRSLDSPTMSFSDCTHTHTQEYKFRKYFH